MSEDIEDVDLVDELDEDLDEDLEVGDGEDLEDEDADDDPDEEPPQPTRGQNRVAAATRKAAEAQERADRLERELQDLRTRPAQPTQPQETREQFNARLANMDPVEREAYLARLDAQSARSDTQALRFEMANQTDKIGFDSLCARHNFLDPGGDARLLAHSERDVGERAGRNERYRPWLVPHDRVDDDTFLAAAPMRPRAIPRPALS